MMNQKEAFDAVKEYMIKVRLTSFNDDVRMIVKPALFNHQYNGQLAWEDRQAYST